MNICCNLCSILGKCIIEFLKQTKTPGLLLPIFFVHINIHHQSREATLGNLSTSAKHPKNYFRFRKYNHFHFTHCTSHEYNNDKLYPWITRTVRILNLKLIGPLLLFPREFPTHASATDHFDYPRNG